MGDQFPHFQGNKYNLNIEKTNSECKQGIILDFGKKIKARVVVEGVDCPNGAILWEDSTQKEVHFEIKGETSDFWVRNAWDWGDGVIQSWHHGAAMEVEEIPNGRRYWCNDGHPDENFDDIVFRIEVTEGEYKKGG